MKLKKRGKPKEINFIGLWQCEECNSVVEVERGDEDLGVITDSFDEPGEESIFARCPNCKTIKWFMAFKGTIDETDVSDNQPPDRVHGSSNE